MAKPTLRRVEAIDADRSYTFSYVWNGLPVVGSILTFKNLTNTTAPDVVIDVTSYLSSVDYEPDELVADGKSKLQNGCKYSASVQVKYSASSDVNNPSLSEVSDTIQFYCFPTPSISINDLIETEDGISKVTTASFNCTLSYDNKGYPANILNTYKVEVYQDAALSVLVRSTDVLYTRGELNNLTAYIGGLNDGYEYYIYAYGSTNYGMDVEGHVYHITVNYSSRLDTAFVASVKNGHVELNIREKIINGHWLVPSLAEYTSYDTDGTPAEAVVVKGNKIYFDKNVDVSREPNISNFKAILKCSDIIIDNETPFLNIAESGVLQATEQLQGAYIKLVAVTNMKYSENLNDKITWTNKDVRILCLASNDRGIIRMTYSNSLPLTITKADDGDYHIVKADLIIELEAKNGYYNLNIRKEVIDV